MKRHQRLTIASGQGIVTALLLLQILVPAAVLARSLANELPSQGNDASPPAPDESEGSVPALDISSKSEPSTVSPDIKHLIHALNMDYLMAEFYSCAAYGKGISEELRGGGPPSRGCQQANLTDAKAVVVELASNEAMHVQLLRDRLGSAAVPMPQLDLGDAFAEAANLAFHSPPPTPFSPYVDDSSFYLGAFLLEEPAGFTFFEGATVSMRDWKNLVLVAKLLGVEAAHSALVRTYLFLGRAKPLACDPRSTVEEAALRFAQLRGKVGAGKGQGLIQVYNGFDGANLVADDHEGLAYARSYHQVLEIVCLGHHDGGGFFPAGLNES